MILLTLSRGKGEETVRLQLPASPAEIGEAFASLDRISLDTTATAILDVSSNVPVLYRCLYDVDVEDSEQFQKLQKLAERTEALSPAKAAIFSGALDAECVWNLEGALTVADRLDEYMLVNNVSSDSELGIYLVNKGITPFPDRFKPYINYARVGAEYREKHGGEYSSGNYVQKKTPELLENERLDGVFRIWMENPCPVRVQSETAQITLPATFEQLESARQLLGVDSLNMAKLTRVEALRPYLGEYLPLQGMDLRLEQLDELAENMPMSLLNQSCGARESICRKSRALSLAAKGPKTMLQLWWTPMTSTPWSPPPAAPERPRFFCTPTSNMPSPAGCPSSARIPRATCSAIMPVLPRTATDTKSPCWICVIPPARTATTCFI